MIFITDLEKLSSFDIVSDDFVNDYIRRWEFTHIKKSLHKLRQMDTNGC